MPVLLTKIVGPTYALSDIPNVHPVTCPRCLLVYRLSCTDDEWHRLKDWIALAETALRRDHDARHEADIVALEWRGIRRR